MTSGGARARSGPPPDPNALRRDRDKAEWTRLPAAGRAGDPPTWPLVRPSHREIALWATEWARPQAVIWEANDQVVEVAMYVRTLVAAEKPRAFANIRTLLRQQMDALGLTVPGLRANRWLIVDEEGAVQDGDRDPAGDEPTSIKDRIRLLAGGAGG